MTRGSEMDLGMIIYLLFVHWVADFVFQSDWMAQNKSKNNLALISHCSVYGIVFMLMTWDFFLGGIVMIIHHPVDYVTSRINSKLWADKKIHWFFVSVGFDQWIHFVTILLVYKLLH